MKLPWLQILPSIPDAWNLDALKEYAKWYFSKMTAKIIPVSHSLSYNATLLHPYQETELISLSLEFQ